MTRDTRVQIFAFALMLLGLTGSVALSGQLAASAGRHKLVYTDRAEDGQTWEVSAGIAMGAFRGLFVNWLWIRANDLKEEGKYWEANQLSDAITRLQPRYPRVWAFHAWNMAYNISVSTQTADERWGWVNAGIQLLRDKGIPANPTDMLLHKELSWIFLHKIAGYTDDANQHYKRRFAQEWTIVMGEPPPRDLKDRSRAGAIARYAAWVREVAEAPGTLEEAIAKEPGVGPLAAALTAIDPLRLDDTLLSRYEIIKHVRQSGRREVLEKGLGPRSQRVVALYDNPGYAKAWPVLVAHIRKRLLVDRYHMEPDRMLRYTEKYGPIDWRCPGAHGLYWAARGVEQAIDRWNLRNMRDFDFTNTDRQVVHSVQELWRYGEVYFDFLAAVQGKLPVMLAVPNPHFIQTYGDIMNEVAERSAFENTGKRIYTSLASGYENLLRDAITYFYQRGDIAEAEKWRERLLKDPRRNTNDRQRTGELSLPLSEFVQKEIEDRFSSPNVAVAEVTGALLGAYASGLLGDDDELFRSQFEFAKRAHRFFFSEQMRRTAAGADLARMEYMDHDFRIHAGLTLYQFMAQLSLDEAARVYANAPRDLRNFVFRPLKERWEKQLDEEAKTVGKSFAVTFPMPEDQESFDKWFAAEMARRAERQAPIEQR